MPERRFTEEEIAAIFEQAAAAQRVAQEQAVGKDGLTLAELHEIGAEAGISPEFISKAVESIDGETPQETPQKFLGQPITVSHTVDIPGRFTDQDWDRLVVDLRQTFQAGGEISLDGSLREWRNGNLYALVEPTESGSKLRMGTTKPELKGLTYGGFGFFVFFVLITLTKFAQLGYELDPKILLLAAMALAGLGVAGFAVKSIPKWAGQRERQMKAIAARVLKARGPKLRDRREKESVAEAETSSGPAQIEIPSESEFGQESTPARERLRE